ncbi:MAG: permease-like cell division protein FtsX [Bacteroidales bacterium]|nr:permease-like cell division protein FtsX [Bacteroidales bacterium]
MEPKQKKNSVWRVRGAYFLSVVSITMVLLMLGLVALMVFNAKKLSDYAKKNIGFTVFIENDTKQAEIDRLENALQIADYSVSAEFVSKEQAALIMKEELGKDFTKILGYNSLPNSIEVKLQPEYTSEDSIIVIKNRLHRFTFIKDIYYQKSLVSFINENIRKMSSVGLVITAFLLMIAVSLINNTVRLSIFSKRLLIRTAQLVGATGTYIRKPFVTKSVFSGIISASMSSLILAGTILLLQENFGDIITVQGLIEIVVFIFVFGIIITGFSGRFAVNKYLRLKTDDLHFEY